MECYRHRFYLFLILACCNIVLGQENREEESAILERDSPLVHLAQATVVAPSNDPGAAQAQNVGGSSQNTGSNGGTGVAPSQPAAPQSSPPRTNARAATQRRDALRGAAGFASAASIPYMIGDTGAGTCLAFKGLLDVDLSHPTLTCSRLNISENNSPLTQDRFYYSYRHFHNLSSYRIYQFSTALDVDRHTLGYERTFLGGGHSIELRVPLEQRLISDFQSSLTPFGIDLIRGDDRTTELANISLIYKTLLLDSRRFTLSTGLGITLPTAEDVTVFPFIAGDVFFPSIPGLRMATTSIFRMHFENETIYLSPFLSYLSRPNRRWFHHGFAQFEFAANPASFIIEGASLNDFFDAGNNFLATYNYGTSNNGMIAPSPGELHAQSLVRLNWGTGRVLYENVDPRSAKRLTGLLELHYTGTLQDAKLTEIPLIVIASAGLPPLQSISVGNQANRVDILNLATGFAVDLNRWKVTNGFIVPLREGTDRGFDFEYNLQLQTRF